MSLLRLRQHTNPLTAANLRRRAGRLALRAGTEVEVEVGCGDARFLIERARVVPSAELVGLEIREEVAALARQGAAEAGVSLHVVVTNANVDLTTVFAPGQLARAFVNFPDPWFKKRHHKRRLVTAELAGDLTSRLRPGGELFFQSDIWDTALDAMAVLEVTAGLCNVNGPWTFCRQNPYGARSDRETVCEADGKPIWRILYQRV
jgi:tRNA (guanine-N7-)-methyltransferase